MKSSSPANDLPSPSDYPQSDVVIFDGMCTFCMAQVRNLKKFDGKNRLSFVSLHDPMVETLCPDLSHDDLMKQMYLRTVAGQVYGGAAALRYLTRRLPRLWIFAPLMHIPFSLPFWQWAYAQVAKRRYKIANKNGEACDPESEGTCAVHFDKK